MRSSQILANLNAADITDEISVEPMPAPDVTTSAKSTHKPGRLTNAIKKGVKGVLEIARDVGKSNRDMIEVAVGKKIYTSAAECDHKGKKIVGEIVGKSMMVHGYLHAMKETHMGTKRAVEKAKEEKAASREVEPEQYQSPTLTRK